MALSHDEAVAEAFSRKAAVYDRFGEGHEQLSRMRQKLYDHLGRVAPAGSHLLELNAGTGLDAVEMIKRGYTVHATDLAAGMVSQIEQKIAHYGLEKKLTVQQCSFTELDQLPNVTFDGLYSNSGGLNCIADLTLATRHFGRLLRPGGTATLVIMPPLCPWEHALLFKDWRVATRRWRPGGVLAQVEGVQFMTYYFTVRQVLAALGPAFELYRLEALALCTPTADNKTFAVNHPTLYRWLVKIDDLLAHTRPFNGWGDFFILTARKK
jgi:ubiquinone/menaquinone biosynthesis C-methylase UbiE